MVNINTSNFLKWMSILAMKSNGLLTPPSANQCLPQVKYQPPTIKFSGLT